MIFAPLSRTSLLTIWWSNFSPSTTVRNLCTRRSKQTSSLVKMLYYFYSCACNRKSSIPFFAGILQLRGPQVRKFKVMIDRSLPDQCCLLKTLAEKGAYFTEDQCREVKVSGKHTRPCQSLDYSRVQVSSFKKPSYS